MRKPRITIPWYPGKPGTKPGQLQKNPRKPADPLVRFISKFRVEQGSGCWLWVGALDKRGYGAFNPGKGSRQQKAHRFVYESVFGQFDKKLFVCHRCDTPRCVNPFHLFLGTNQDNVTDMMRKGRHATQRKSAMVFGSPGCNEDVFNAVPNSGHGDEQPGKRLVSGEGEPGSPDLLQRTG